MNGSLKFVFVIAVYDYICVYDLGHFTKINNTLKETSSAFKQSASKHTQLQISTLAFVYAKDKCCRSGGFSGHSSNIAFFISFLSLSDIPLYWLHRAQFPNMMSVPYSEPLW